MDGPEGRLIRAQSWIGEDWESHRSLPGTDLDEVCPMRRSPRPPSRYRWKLATLLGLIAFSAVIFRGVVYRSSRWTVRVVNESATALEDVELVRDGARWSFGTIRPGEMAEVVLRVDSSRSGPALLRYRQGKEGRSVNLSSGQTGGRVGPGRVREEIRLDERGLRSHEWSIVQDLFR